MDKTCRKTESKKISRSIAMLRKIKPYVPQTMQDYKFIVA